eukprot:6369744-Amphidinium_carterae.1
MSFTGSSLGTVLHGLTMACSLRLVFQPSLGARTLPIWKRNLTCYKLTFRRNMMTWKRRGW